jgi:Kef-type K+ transport system membrane component KefB
MGILYLGVILLAGYFFSVFFEKIGFPKIMGYLVAGLILNPQITDIIPADFDSIADQVTTFCLAFITFEIGSSFSINELRTTGRKYFTLAFYESFTAFVFVLVGFFAITLWLFPIAGLGMHLVVAFTLLLASLAAPTDPSATLAVIHEYKAKGPVTKAILGAAAFDDIVTLFLFSFSLSFARSYVGTVDVSFVVVLYHILYKITGAVLTGVFFGFIFNKTVSLLNIKERKSQVVIFLGFLSFTYGIATWLKMDELFSTLTLGFMVRNFNVYRKQILEITEQGIEDLFFLIFFVFNAMAFDFSSTNISIVLSILLFILIRAAGKYTGMYIGTHRLKMDEKVKRYAFAGLIPQGGIVLGLSLMLSKEPEFHVFANVLSGIIMGATILHEFMGPVISHYVLKKAGETEE